MLLESLTSLARMMKRYVWVWPVLMAALTILGFRWVSPNTRVSDLEAQVAVIPESTAVAIERQVAPLREAIEAQRVRDSVAQVQMAFLTRIGAVGVALQCRDLPIRERDLLRELAQVCTQTSQRSGIPFPRP